jgi:hypothetical protein
MVAEVRRGQWFLKDAEQTSKAGLIVSVSDISLLPAYCGAFSLLPPDQRYDLLSMTQCLWALFFVAKS